MPASVAPAEEEASLQEFLDGLEDPLKSQIRTLAHAWAGGGGHFTAGRLAVRLLGGLEDRPYTAGYLHARPAAKLELWRVMLENHGIDTDAWTHWSDEIGDIQHGFDPAAKFPCVEMDDELEPSELVRLVVALRDLARMAHDRAA